MDREFGETIAARLKEGSREEYEKVQLFLRNAVERQEWLYGDMVMRIIWALLPPEAQQKISKGFEPAARRIEAGGRAATIAERSGRVRKTVVQGSMP